MSVEACDATLPNLWVIVPAYEEEGALARTIVDIRRFAPNVVVIDDGSRDGTSAVARAGGAIVVRHLFNLGQGAALQTGMEYALRHGADYICTFDADGQHDAATIPLMLQRLIESGDDVALGSRFLGGTIGMTRSRRFVLGAAVAFTRFQTRLPITDTHNGLRMFTRYAASRIRISQSGMAHGSELLSSIVRLRLTAHEVPTVITYTAYSRRKGQSLFNSVKIAIDLMYAALCH